MYSRFLYESINVYEYEIFVKIIVNNYYNVFVMCLSQYINNYNKLFTVKTKSTAT